MPAFALFTLLALMLMLAGPLCAKAQGTRDLDDISALAGPPKIAGPSLSAGGQWVAAFLYDDQQSTQKLTVWFEGKSPKTGDHLPYAFDEIDWYAWIGGARLVLSLKGKGLVTYDAAIGALTPLLEQGRRPLDKPVTLLSTLPGDRGSLLISFSDTQSPYPAVYRVDLAQKKAVKIIDPFPPVRRWWTSSDGAVALGEGFQDGYKILYRQSAEGGWEVYLKRHLIDDPTLHMLAVARGGRQLYVAEAAGEGGVHSLRRYSLGDAESVETLFTTPTAEDVTDVVFNPANGFLVGAIYGTSGPLVAPLDPWVDRLQSLLPDAIAPSCRPLTAAEAREKVLALCDPPGVPKSHWVIDTKAQKARRLLGPAAPVPSYQVETVTLEETQERYLIATRPKSPASGQTSQGDILWIHGGPHERVTGQYDPMIAYLTLKGYRVFLANFVGSTGYGDAFERAGWGGWGTSMQVSLYRVASAIRDTHQGSKTGFFVMGLSYGGYASLLMAAERPDLTRCALSINGVTSLPRFHGAAKHVNDFFVSRFMGDLKTKDLFGRSPIARIHAKQAPVLLIHGTADRRVSPAHLEDYKAVTRRDFIPARFTYIDGADHGFSQSVHKIKLWRRIGDFFERCDSSP